MSVEAFLSLTAHASWAIGCWYLNRMVQRKFDYHLFTRGTFTLFIGAWIGVILFFTLFKYEGNQMVWGAMGLICALTIIGYVFYSNIRSTNLKYGFFGTLIAFPAFVIGAPLYALYLVLWFFQDRRSEAQIKEDKRNAEEDHERALHMQEMERQKDEDRRRSQR